MNDNDFLKTPLLPDSLSAEQFRMALALADMRGAALARAAGMSSGMPSVWKKKGASGALVAVIRAILGPENWKKITAP